ncbi:MAG: hypothetical protein WCH39_16415 [Schlesneria sp.]
MKGVVAVVAMLAVILLGFISDVGFGRDSPIKGAVRRSSSELAYRKAVAAVVIARAALEIADERPILPDARSFQNAIESIRQSVEIDDSGGRVTNHKIPSPMRIEFPNSVVIHETLPAQLVIGHWAHGCQAGDRLERDIRRVLTPLGWKIGNSIGDVIQFVHIPQTEPCPKVTLYQNGVILKSWEGYQDRSFLSNELRRAWDSAPSSAQHMATAGSAGVIHARSQIQSLFDWWRKEIGEGVTGSVNWDRTGAQTFPFLAQGDWSTLALFGKSGRIEVSAYGAKALPVDSLGFSYRVIGDDMSFDCEPVLVKGLAGRLGAGSKPGALKNGTYGTETENDIVPAGFGLMGIWTMTTVVRDIFALLNPTCDLQLGGNVAATGVLKSDTLSVDFQQSPSVKLVALFTFQLAVKRVEITEHSIRVFFSGSRLVKERTFQVQ